MNKKDKILDLVTPETNGVSEPDLQRRLHFVARFLITICQFCLLVLMLILLFYTMVPDSSRDLVSAITGMLVISQKDAVQYWFSQHHSDNNK
jgi:predicted PurR-regulated permease PerM